MPSQEILSEALQPPAGFIHSREIDLSKKCAIVTGSGRGIGFAIALKLAYHGAKVIINSTERSQDEALAALAEIQKYSSDSQYVCGSVAEKPTATELVKAALTIHDRLDILVNNAGIIHDAFAMRMSEAQWDQVMNVNLRGAFLVTHAAVRQMYRQNPKGGVVINVSSISSRGGPGQMNYSASKAGLEGMAKSLALEGTQYGVRANSVAFGLAETALTSKMKPEEKEAILVHVPMGRYPRLEELADPVLYLASDRASFITGQTIFVDGGAIR